MYACVYIYIHLCIYNDPWLMPDALYILKRYHRSEFLHRERLGLSGSQISLENEGVAHLAPPANAGNPFQVAWRNYIKTVFKKGFMFKLSISPSVILYVSENKTLAGKEDRVYEGEAMGRKLAIVFFEDAPGGLVQRVNRESLGLTPQLLTIAEILQACGYHLPPDPERSAGTTELLLEAHYQNLEIERLPCTIDPEAPQVHMYSLGPGDNAEDVLACEVPPDQRTKMVLARCLERNRALRADETLQLAWAETLVALQGRAAPYLPAPPVAAAGVAPAAVPRGREGARGRGRGRGVVAPAPAAPLPPAPPPAPPAPPPARGGGRGRARGRGR